MLTKPAKILASVGANDETVAHLRLLLRMGAAKLDHDWRWGSDEEADFVVVQPGAMASEAVQTRCQAAGVPFAVLCEQTDVVVQGMALRRPLKLDQVLAVFNAAGASSTRITGVQSFGEDFYSQNIDAIPVGASAVEAWANERDAASASITREAAAREAPVQDLDHLLYGDPLAEPVELGPMVTSDAQIAESESTSRSERRRDGSDAHMAASLVGVSTVDTAPPLPRGPNAPALRSAAVKKKQDDPPRPLLDYIDGDLVASPTQLRLEGAPIVTLDPKHRQFHATGALGGLAAYVEQGIASEQIGAVAGTELARVRLTEPGRSYDELRWLNGLLKSNGSLSSRLDPGGAFCVRAPLVLDPEYRMHGAIAAALTAPARLHEVAQMSGAPMAEVFDIVNAYDAIGRLEWTPRAPRKSAQPEKAAGALSKFKWPFGRK